MAENISQILIPLRKEHFNITFTFAVGEAEPRTKRSGPATEHLLLKMPFTACLQRDMIDKLLLTLRCVKYSRALQQISFHGIFKVHLEMSSPVLAS